MPAKIGHFTFRAQFREKGTGPKFAKTKKEQYCEKGTRRVECQSPLHKRPGRKRTWQRKRKVEKAVEVELNFSFEFQFSNSLKFKSNLARCLAKTHAPSLNGSRLKLIIFLLLPSAIITLYLTDLHRSRLIQSKFLITKTKIGKSCEVD